MILSLCRNERLTICHIAYVPVVASGSNALIIHYTDNNRIMKDGELVLVDAGCELHGYASDISAPGSPYAASRGLLTSAMSY